MKFILDKSGIVLGAVAHNPSILSPLWLKTHHLINEEPEKFLNTVEFSMIELKDILMFVDRDQLQITAKKDDVEVRTFLMDIINGYIKLLPHVPYKSLGLNFRWFVEIEENEQFPKIIFSIGNSNLQSAIDTKNELLYGGTIYVREDLFNLKINIQPNDKNKKDVLFHYHYTVENKKPEDIIVNINNFLEFHKKSEKFLINIFDIERKG